MLKGRVRTQQHKIVGCEVDCGWCHLKTKSHQT